MQTSGLSGEISVLWQALSGWTQSHWSQILVATLFGSAIVAGLYAVRQLGIWLCRPGRRSNSGWRDIIGRTLAKTRFWFMAAVAAQSISWIGLAPPTIASFAHGLFIIAICLQAAVWVRALLLGVVEKRAETTDPEDTLQSAVGLIRILLTATLFILAAILILANLGVDVTGLLAGLGIGGIAIGLAAQGIFSDLFAALSILFDKPFRKGDLIRWETTTGEVEYIGLKSSRIRALSGEEIVISNANLLSKELRNFARVETRRVNQPLSLVYHTPIEKCADMAMILAPAINACEGVQFQRVGLETFGASSLDFMLVYDLTAADQADVLARRNSVNLALLQTFANEGISFAYPTQTTFTAAPDGTMVMPYAQPK